MENSEIIRCFHKMRFGEEIFLDLMKYKIKEILLISSIYDAYMLQHEGSIDENISQQFKRLDLTIPPRITLVTEGEEALELAKSGKFDLVLGMIRVGKKTSFDLLKTIKHTLPELPLLLLLNKLSYRNYVSYYSGPTDFFDEIFIWNGDPQLFIAMIKYIEDMKNVEDDIKIGNVAVTLLVETSQDYFSRFLTLCYTQAIKFVRGMIYSERNDMDKMIRMRMRSKFVVAHSYDKAIELYQKYKDNINCVMTNVNYYLDEEADFIGGYKLAKKIREADAFLPILLQSADENNKVLATKVKAAFVHKNSDNFLHEFRKFIYDNLGYGDFIFEDKNGKEIARAHNIKELEKIIDSIPDEIIEFHLKAKHFSNWLQAHGALIAKNKVQMPKEIETNENIDIKNLVRNIIRGFRINKDRGKIVEFDETSFFEDGLIVRLAGGSLGGKGRGLAFLNAISVAFDLRDQFPGTKIIIPKTAIIGAEEYDEFMERNQIFERVEGETNEVIRKIFINSKLSDNLIKRLKIFLMNYKQPLAVRSSGLLEDSLSQPFAGIYQTFIIPNSSENFNERLQQLKDAIKLVLSSPFMQKAEDYIYSIGNKVEEEKMAVIIQEVAGSVHSDGKLFYPHISGVAQSHNFYPAVGRKASDGIATIAAGFGKSVVDGERAYRYCPKFPKHDLLDAKKQIDNCQWDFYALDLDPKKYDININEGLEKINISPKILDGELKQLSSVWDYQYNQFIDGNFAKGDRVITFRNITKYQQYPLNDILQRVMEIGEIGMGVPVEIEFAVDLSKNNRYNIPIFSLLQIRPMTINNQEINIDISSLDFKSLLLKTDKSMGNMAFDDIYDLIYIDPSKFKNTQTMQMVLEIAELNKRMREQDKKYILIGPGRWGTSDRFLGVPVSWSQIDYAKIIVETDLPDFIVDSSQGSHFFHNLVAAKVGYLKIPINSEENFINWWKLEEFEVEEATSYFRHIRVDKPFKVKIDGKSGIGIISC